MAGKLVWLTGDEGGDSHVAIFDMALSGLGERTAEGSLMRLRHDISPTAVSFVELPKQADHKVLHPAPRRQFVIVLQGELEVIASDGASCRMQPGDVLFADDIGSKGHRVKDVGEEHFVTIQLAMPTDWDWPSALARLAAPVRSAPGLNVTSVVANGHCSTAIVPLRMVVIGPQPEQPRFP